MSGTRITDQQVRLYMNKRKHHSQEVAAAKTGISVRTARRIERDATLPSRKPRHSWRTRPDPFADVWDSEVVPLLRNAPHLMGITVLRKLQDDHPDRYPDSMRRTLERRIRQWRALEGPTQEVFFPQEHQPGVRGLSDFTDMSKLCVTIGGAPFGHRLYHFVLAFSRWVAQGGDWGSAITHALASQRPQGLVAAHVNLPLVAPEVLPDHPSKEEREAIESIDLFLDHKARYADQMNTRPQTIGYALDDSPLALAMWMYEKFGEWTANRGRPEDALSHDQMFDDISLYWFTGTGTTSARLYWESCSGKTIREHTFFSSARASSERIELPMGASISPRENYVAPRVWAEAAWANLFYWHELDRGGHFAAFEQPELFATEVARAFRVFREKPAVQ
jgi:pimeloyl-ACP methyl ester carboxylesterase